MSSKSTLALTENGEHWYHDCSHPEEVTLEIDRKNCNVEINKDYIVVNIPRGSHLYNLLYHSKFADDNKHLPTDDDKKYKKDFNVTCGMVEGSA